MQHLRRQADDDELGYALTDEATPAIGPLLSRRHGYGGAQVAARMDEVNRSQTPAVSQWRRSTLGWCRWVG
jgi:hypothetical protein